MFFFLLNKSQDIVDKLNHKFTTIDIRGIIVIHNKLNILLESKRITVMRIWDSCKNIESYHEVSYVKEISSFFLH